MTNPLRSCLQKYVFSRSLSSSVSVFMHHAFFLFAQDVIKRIVRSVNLREIVSMSN